MKTNKLITNTNKLITNTNIIYICLFIIFISSISLYLNSLNKDKIYKAKIILLNQKINKKSDIEILSDKALKSLKSSNDNMNNINSLKETISKVQKTYEHNILLNRCYKEQIARKINGVEYNIKYCDDDKNLESYRVKKQLR